MATIRKIDGRGRITLSDAYAGEHYSISESADGVWTVTPLRLVRAAVASVDEGVV